MLPSAISLFTIGIAVAPLALLRLGMAAADSCASETYSIQIGEEMPKLYRLHFYNGNGYGVYLTGDRTEALTFFYFSDLGGSTSDDDGSSRRLFQDHLASPSLRGTRFEAVVIKADEKHRRPPGQGLSEDGAPSRRIEACDTGFWILGDILGAVSDTGFRVSFFPGYVIGDCAGYPDGIESSPWSYMASKDGPFTDASVTVECYDADLFTWSPTPSPTMSPVSSSTDADSSSTSSSSTSSSTDDWRHYCGGCFF